MGATPKVEITIFWQPVSPLILLTQFNGEELVCNIQCLQNQTCKVASPKSRACVFHNSVMMNGSTLKKFPGTYNCRYSGELYPFDSIAVIAFILYWWGDSTQLPSHNCCIVERNPKRLFPRSLQTSLSRGSTVILHIFIICVTFSFSVRPYNNLIR